MPLKGDKVADTAWRINRVYHFIRDAEKYKKKIIPFFSFPDVCKLIKSRALLEKYKARETGDKELTEKYSRLARISDRTIRRYLYELKDDERIVIPEDNHYCSDIVWGIKEIIESTFSSKFLDKVDVWKSKAISGLWEEILFLKPEWESANPGEVMNQVEDWVEKHLKIYLAASDEISDERLNHAAMHFILKMIGTITRMMGMKPPLLSDKGFTIIIDFKPTPFNLEIPDNYPARLF